MTSVLHTLAMQNTTQQSGGSLGVSIEIIGATVLACVLLTATVLLLTKFRRRRDPMFFREQQAKEQMQELCPHGWTARIILYGEGAPMPDDAPTAGERRVCVEWTEYERTQPAIPRSPLLAGCGPTRSPARCAGCWPTASSMPSWRRSSGR